MKRISPLRFGCLCAALILPVLGLFALEDYLTIAPRVERSPISVPSRSVMAMFIPDGKGGYLKTETSTDAISTASGIELRSDTPQAFTRTVFDSHGRIIAYENTLKPLSDEAKSKVIASGRGDKIHTLMTWISGRTYRQSTLDKDGREEVKEFGLEPKDILFVQLPYQIQRALKAGITQGFNFDAVMGPSFRQNFDVRLIMTTAPRSVAPKYQYPAPVKELMDRQGFGAVAELGITGLASALYPHKIYFAYGPAPEFRIKAFWGGEPGKDFFQVETMAETPAR